jgi:glycosyltransferase involved in cell wall biosynthesis
MVSTRLAFLTSTPLNFERGSGTFAGIAGLSRGLGAHGVDVQFFTPRFHSRVYTLERLRFNYSLSSHIETFSNFRAVVGFDMDGYRVAGRHPRPHIASIKGVLADELRFEGGLTRRTMAIQARCERLHVRRADRVVTTSRYAAGRIHELYGLAHLPEIVPETIDLSAWRELFRANPATAYPDRFTVLSVCRLYPRKRIAVLLAAAARLESRIPGLHVRIVGRGPDEARLRRLADGLKSVHWLGDVSQADLAREYSSCDVFCLPSVQEGFGIVFLEAMAAGKPIVAARASAVPEVAPQGLLVAPEDPEAMAGAIERLYLDADLRRGLGEAGLRRVREFDAPRVARRFLDVIAVE